MTLTDTHTHLYSESFDSDRDAVIKRAINQNVTRFFIPAIDSTYTQRMYDLKKAYPEHMYLMMGLHPTHVKPESYKKELSHVERELVKHKFVAIGEIGIDLYWDKSTLAIQQEAFKAQIKLAKANNLPIVIHCRDAFDEVFEVLESEMEDSLFGILHAFTGNLKQAKQAISYNMKLGIGGVVTFKNGGLNKFIHEIPLENIVLETDSPYLTPSPHRGKRNESSYITLIADTLANLYKRPKSEIITLTTQTSKAIFKI